MKFITLGPSGSNHEFVAHRYLDFHRLRDHATIDLAPDFERGALAVLQREADYMIQCAVHPATMSTVAKWFDGLFVIDTFISPSRNLAVVQRRGVVDPRTLVVMAPTLDYIDRKRWEHIQLAPTVAEVSRGLIAGEYEAGLAYASIADDHPERLQITQFIGTVDDAWIVYGRERVSTGHLLAWPNSPASQLYREGI